MIQPAIWLNEQEAARPLEGRLHAASHDTEEIAARMVKPRSGTQRARVLARFRSDSYGGRGYTDFEMSAALGLLRHAAGTRREELIRDGWPIVDTGQRRFTDTGRPAIVWKLERPAETARVGGL